jgi:hypothetical protein
VRHAKDITIDGLTLATATPDARPPIKVEDAPGLKVTRTPLWRG